MSLGENLKALNPPPLEVRESTARSLEKTGMIRQPRRSRSPHSAARGGGRSSSNHHELGMYREDRRWFEVRRLVSAFAMAIVLLLFALPAAAQDDGLQVCDWYWDYKFNT